jgi:hypothetical protein
MVSSLDRPPLSPTASDEPPGKPILSSSGYQRKRVLVEVVQ